MPQPMHQPENPEERQRWLERAVEFVRSIGLSVKLVGNHPLEPGSFLPQIRIRAGGLEVREDAFPGDVLHEAGHIAVLPPAFRPLADKNLRAAFAAARAYCDEHGDGLMAHPEDPVVRALLQCSDPEATAWQYAAANAIGLPDAWLFPAGSYEGNQETVLQMLKLNRHFGINGLQAAGWTQVSRNPYRATPVYPALAFWLHPGAELHAAQQADGVPG
jgi:hypothetical protein